MLGDRIYTHDVAGAPYTLHITDPATSIVVHGLDPRGTPVDCAAKAAFVEAVVALEPALWVDRRRFLAWLDAAPWSNEAGTCAAVYVLDVRVNAELLRVPFVGRLGCDPERVGLARFDWRGVPSIVAVRPGFARAVVAALCMAEPDPEAPVWRGDA